MLLDHASAKKTGALATSVTLQAIAVGLMILIPLIYGDRLNLLPTESVFSIPLSAPPAPRPVESTPAPAQPTRPSILPSRIFRLQTQSPAALPQPVLIDSGAPSIADPTAPPDLVSSTVLPPPIVVAPPARETAIATKPLEKPVPVGGDVQAAKLIKKVVPQYPALARMARVSGTVHLLGIIAKDGTIQRLQVVSGNPLLVQAAVDAVRQWVYRPTLLNGEVVEVIAPIDVIFTLSQ